MHSVLLLDTVHQMITSWQQQSTFRRTLERITPSLCKISPLTPWMVAWLMVHVCLDTETLDQAQEWLQKGTNFTTSEHHLLNKCVRLHQTVVDTLQNSNRDVHGQQRVLGSCLDIEPFIQAYEVVCRHPLIAHIDTITATGALGRLSRLLSSLRT